MLYIFYCCFYLVAVTVRSSHQVFCEKRHSWRFRRFHWRTLVLKSLFSLVAGLITCGCPVWFAKFLQAPILNNICEQLLLYWYGFVLLFFMLWYNVPLIFNHFTCYLSIQLSSVFSWSLTYLARVLVMFLFFSFPCVTKVTSYKTLFGPFIIYHVYKSWLHLPTAQRCFYFSLLNTSTGTSGINSTMLQWLIVYVSFYYLYSTVVDSSS